MNGVSEWRVDRGATGQTFDFVLTVRDNCHLSDKPARTGGLGPKLAQFPEKPVLAQRHNFRVP